MFSWEKENIGESNKRRAVRPRRKVILIKSYWFI